MLKLEPLAGLESTWVFCLDLSAHHPSHYKVIEIHQSRMMKGWLPVCSHASVLWTDCPMMWGPDPLNVSHAALLCLKATWDVLVVLFLDDHLYSSSSTSVIHPQFFCDDPVFIHHQQRGLGRFLALPLTFFRMKLDWSCFFLLFLLSLTPHSALLHISTYIYFIILIIPSFALKLTQIHYQYFLFPLLNPLFFSICSSSPFVSLLPPSSSIGRESALPTEQHRCSGQRHVLAFRQPGHRVSVRGRHLGQEAPAQDRTGSQAHVQGETDWRETLNLQRMRLRFVVDETKHRSWSTTLLNDRKWQHDAGAWVC